MDETNTIFFTSCNNSYIRYAIVSLTKIRDFSSSASLAVICKDITIENKKLLKKASIKYYDLDMSDAFKPQTSYPEECFYYFAGPELFAKEGFEYSVYLDVDILCNGNPYLKTPPKGIAGVPINGKEAVFGDDVETIKNVFSFPKENLERKRINSGVIYFNNAFALKKDFSEKTKELCKKCAEQGISQMGDSSLFSLFQLVYCGDPDVRLLSSRFNYIPSIHSAPSHDCVRFFHFSPIEKPWSNKSEPRFEAFYVEWRKKYRSIFPLEFIGSKIKARTALCFLDRLYNNARNILLWLNGLKYGVIRRINNSKKEPIKLFWYKDDSANIRNFGDELSVELIKRVFGYYCTWTSFGEAELIAVGSLMQLFLENPAHQDVYVWGAGFIKEGAQLKLTKNIKICALRGRMSSNRIFPSQDVALGDPGLFASICFPREKKNSTKKIGVVLHYVDMSNEVADKIRKNPNYMLINPLDDVETVARKVSSCSFIISSSLHGLIFADSYGIPNAHVVLSDKVTGGEYKFKDYCTGVGKTYNQIAVQDIFNDELIFRIAREYRRVSVRKICRKLVKKFPF